MKKNVIWKILIYFIVYSICGFIIETIYAIFTKGMLESRQSFLYGPFCIVYGIAAICLIFLLSKYKNNTIKLFFYGMIVGCIIEYYSSYIGEIILHVKWWDYTNDFLNVHGRTCLYYAVLWGVLTIPLIRYINPALDKIIDKVSEKISYKNLKLATAFVTLFLVLDGALTCYALDSFLIRVSNEYELNIVGINRTEKDNSYLGALYPNETMMMVYPNIIIVNDKEEVVHLENILKDVKNYYYKFDKK